MMGLKSNLTSNRSEKIRVFHHSLSQVKPNKLAPDLTIKIDFTKLFNSKVESVTPLARPLDGPSGKILQSLTDI
jgi:hypothetical protein